MVERAEVLIKWHILVLDRFKISVFWEKIAAWSCRVKSWINNSRTNKQPSIPLSFQTLPRVFFFLCLSIEIFVDLVENAQCTLAFAILVRNLLVPLLLLLRLPPLHFLLFRYCLLLVNFLQLGKTVSEPIVPPVERYFQRFYLLEKLLAVYLIDVFRIVLLRVKHFVGKDSEHEIFLFGITSNRESAIDVGRISKRIEINTLDGQRRDRNWWAQNRCLTICQLHIINMDVIS